MRIYPSFLVPVLFVAGHALSLAQQPPVPTGLPLKTLGAQHHLLIGASSDLDHNDPNEEAIIKREYSVLSDENCLKPRIVEPSRNQFNFDRSDLVMKFCRDNGIVAKGHTLMGRNLYLPKWMLDPTLTPDDLQQILVNHITSVVDRYKTGSPYGEIKYWDVLNEVISGPGKSVFEKLGKNSDGDFRYWEVAFQTAHAADPNCILIWNEDAMESSPKKAEKLYQAIKRLKAKGIPIDGVGFQCHIVYQGRPIPNYDQLAQMFQKFADLGLYIVISEMDVPDSVDQADVYKNILKICVNQPKCVIWDTWNVVDKYSWRAKNEKGLLLFDDNYAPKPTYYAVQAALSGAPDTTTPPPPGLMPETAPSAPPAAGPASAPTPAPAATTN